MATLFRPRTICSASSREQSAMKLKAPSRSGSRKRGAASHRVSFRSLPVVQVLTTAMRRPSRDTLVISKASRPWKVQSMAMAVPPKASTNRARTTSRSSRNGSVSTDSVTGLLRSTETTLDFGASSLASRCSRIAAISLSSSFSCFASGVVAQPATHPAAKMHGKKVLMAARQLRSLVPCFEFILVNENCYGSTIQQSPETFPPLLLHQAQEAAREVRDRCPRQKGLTGAAHPTDEPPHRAAFSFPASPLRVMLRA